MKKKKKRISKTKKRAKIQRSQTRKRARTIESLRQQIVAQDEVIRDMDRQLRTRWRGIHIVEEPGEEEEEITVPKGATILQRDEEGNPVSWSIEDYLGSEYQEIDFDDFDWDDVYEEVGDEDEDDYPGDEA